MSRITLARTAVAAAAAATAVLLTAVPAAAHVEVESDNAQALAQNVALTFTAESESGTAGITELRVILPKGITPADVAYGKGPEGWKFSTTADGYAVKGPALKVGADVEHSVVVRQLPDAKELVFKTLQTYGDGKVDRWIELDDSGGDHGHGNEAPVLALKAAAPGAKPVSPSPTAPDTPSASPTPTTEPAASPDTQAAADTTNDDDNGMSAVAWTGIAAVFVVALTAVVFAVRRRNSAQR
ncbi:DUF1775 domain-containing protein [Streptomyces sp. YU58]|uniref:DUF1775 domain-containing protein n=1 Tax=Streptomyces sp. SX92 TaxID=3158972 RepID=UPI0027BAA7DF|nr:DUF1775 domain-containing protein [Streptomyces coralus]WLW50204.1 DUF1775 domain-containing protein [Streptomyces coralus]